MKTRGAWLVLAAATLTGGWQDAPDRDEWQQPERVMDVLHIADGSRVAELEADRAWFTTRLAHRVGPNGRVSAQDSRPERVEAIQRRLKSEDLKNIQPILAKVPTRICRGSARGAHRRCVRVAGGSVRVGERRDCARAERSRRHHRFQERWRWRTGTATGGADRSEKIIRDAERAGLRLTAARRSCAISIFWCSVAPPDERLRARQDDCRGGDFHDVEDDERQEAGLNRAPANA